MALPDPLPTDIAEPDHNAISQPARQQQQALAQKHRGHYGYFGVSSNIRALARFYRETRRIWQKWLSRRSHAGYVDWSRMLALLERFPLPQPVITRRYAT